MKKEIPSDIVGVSAFIPWRGRVLALQRADSERFLPRDWELPGGKVEHGEHPYETVVREVREETGLSVEPLQTFALFHDTLPDGRNYVGISIACRLLDEDPQPTLSPEDHQAFRWIMSEDLAAVVPMSDHVRGVITKGLHRSEVWSAT